MTMFMKDLLVSQRRLRNPAQLPGMIDALKSSCCLPKMFLVSRCDGKTQINDGHHRAVAYRLTGAMILPATSYVLVPQNRYARASFGSIDKLLESSSKAKKLLDSFGASFFSGVISMVAVWLYAVDGHALYYVEMQLPMPLTVTFGGLMFQWSASSQRYVQIQPAQVNIAERSTPQASKEHYPT